MEEEETTVKFGGENVLTKRNKGGEYSSLRIRNKNKKNQICWQAVPCKYDDYKPDSDDTYRGDVFGRLSDFESPHLLYRSFHRNYCKALVISHLLDYKMVEKEEAIIEKQIKMISEGFSIDGIARHNSLVLLIGAVETYLKDSFIMILDHVYPEKKRGKSSDQIARRYSFQNLKSIVKAYKWLCPEFDNKDIYLDKDFDYFEKIIDLYPPLTEMIERRHRIVHESHYFEDLNLKRLRYYAILCLMWADKFDWFFEDKGYYKSIDNKNIQNQI